MKTQKTNDEIGKLKFQEFLKINKNIYQLLREEVGLTREQAEEALEYISSDRIEKIEADKVIVRPDEVLNMAKASKGKSNSK